MSEHVDGIGTGILLPGGGSLYALMEQIDKKHAEGHERHTLLLRGISLTLETVASRLSSLEKLQAEQQLAMQTLERRKVEVSNIRFTPQMMIGLAIFCVSVVTGQKWAVSGVDDKIVTLATSQKETISAVSQMKTQLDAQQQVAAANQKLQDDRAANTTMNMVRIANQVSTLDAKVTSLQGLPRR